MRIACLQFAPAVGDVDNNLNRADAVLSRADPQELDLLILPELAFSGYNFKSLQQISPYLEHSGSGISALWARTQALKHECTVIAGYPETVDLSDAWPANPEYYNAAAIVGSDGEVLGNYRKTHLYYTDETWALENPGTFFSKRLPGLGQTAMGICMDLNPYKFEAPWDKFELAQHVLDTGARLVVMSMAWITQEEPSLFSQHPNDPDLNTLTYWVSRLEPIINAELEEEIIVVFANRTGMEEDATYAGTSAVLGIQSGEVRVYGLLGRGEKELLVVDTESPPFAKLVYRQDKRKEEAKTNSHGQSGVTQQNGADRRGTRGGYAEHQNGSQGTSSTASSSSKRTPPVHHEVAKSFSPYKKNGNSVRSAPKHSVEPPLQTPSAPSPTPQDIRPLLPRETEHVRSPWNDRSKSHLSQSSSQHGSYTQKKYQQTEDQLVGTHTPRKSRQRKESFSPAKTSVTHFTDPSKLSWVHDWIEKDGNHVGVSETPFTTFDTGGEDDDNVDFVTAYAARENRHSIRSDVSVWNNQPGRVPSIMSGRPSAHQSPPKENPEPVQKSARKTSRRNTNERASRSRNDRPEASTSQIDDQSYKFDRSLSAVPSASDMDAVHRRLTEVRQRAESAQGRLNSQKATRATSQEPRPRGLSRQQTTPSVPAHAHERTLSGGSIPIAMDASVWSQVRDSPNRLPRHSSGAVGTRNRKYSRSASRTRFVGTGTQNEEQAQSGTPGNYESRATSRGRTRSARLEQDQSTPSRQSRAGSRRAQDSPEAIDLSQFNLIEEYPSANCPVHGRSQSGSRPRHSSHQRTPAKNRAQSSAQDPGTNRSLSALQKAHAKAASSSTTDLTKTTRPRESPAPRPSTSTMVSSSSTLSFGQEPKTPKAMVFFNEPEESCMDNIPADFVPSLEYTDNNHPLGFARPRSAVW